MDKVIGDFLFFFGDYLSVALGSIEYSMLGSRDTADKLDSCWVALERKFLLPKYDTQTPLSWQLL